MRSLLSFLSRHQSPVVWWQVVYKLYSQLVVIKLPALIRCIITVNVLILMYVACGCCANNLYIHHICTDYSFSDRCTISLVWIAFYNNRYLNIANKLITDGEILVDIFMTWYHFMRFHSVFEWSVVIVWSYSRTIGKRMTVHHPWVEFVESCRQNNVCHVSLDWMLTVEWCAKCMVIYIYICMHVNVEIILR